MQWTIVFVFSARFHPAQDVLSAIDPLKKNIYVKKYIVWITSSADYHSKKKKTTEKRSKTIWMRCNYWARVQQLTIRTEMKAILGLMEIFPPQSTHTTLRYNATYIMLIFSGYYHNVRVFRAACSLLAVPHPVTPSNKEIKTLFLSFCILFSMLMNSYCILYSTLRTQLCLSIDSDTKTHAKL